MDAGTKDPREQMGTGRELYNQWNALAAHPNVPWESLSELDRTRWKLLDGQIGSGAATHVSPSGTLCIPQPPGHEDGTIGIWIDGRWAAAETSNAFERDLIRIRKFSRPLYVIYHNETRYVSMREYVEVQNANGFDAVKPLDFFQNGPLAGKVVW